VLVLLHRGAAHGYNLINELDEFGFQPGRKDPSLLYRALREMEEIGLVTSEWHQDSLGPHRRVYQITSEGEAFLEDWIEDLRKTRREIDSLLLAYESVKANSD
jgi:DNA-binding PadR family transcriptional regulator